MMKSIHLLLSISCAAALLPLQAEETSPGKVIAVYSERNTTKLIVESKESLISGRNIYVGSDYIPATVGDLLSKSEYLQLHKALAERLERAQKGKTAGAELPVREISPPMAPQPESLYYYGASVPGKPKIQNGDIISLERPVQPMFAPKKLVFKIVESYAFAQKKRGEITAVQGDRAMIDRGSLHEVNQRDIYRVDDSSGRYKCMLELRGIGDLQSQGRLYDTLENHFQKTGGALSVQPGDRATFIGQRKLFSLGILGGLRSRNDRIIAGREQAVSSGLVWATTSLDGWSMEILFGGAFRAGNSDLVVESVSGFSSLRDQTILERSANFIAPIWLKKSFFYPSLVSPFAAAGLTLLEGSNHYHREISPGPTIDETRRAKRIEPVLGFGIELFTGRFFHPRVEARWFGGPKLTAAGNTYYTESWFWNVGFLTAW